MKTEKEKYHGLITQRITVESATLVDASRVPLKAKTKHQDWGDGGNTSIEMGITDMTITDISSGGGARESNWHTEF